MSSQTNAIQMLILVILSIGCVFLVHSNALKERDSPLSLKESTEFMKNITSECNLPNISFIDLFDPYLNETLLQDTKCAMGCLMKKLGLITENNKYDHQGTEHFIRLLPESIDSDEDVVCDQEDFETRCSKIKAENECDVAWDLFFCLLRVCHPHKKYESAEVKVIEKYV